MNNTSGKRELLRQIITFECVALISLASELSIYFIVKYILVDICRLTSDANWFVFQSYSEADGGLGMFIAFLSSTLAAQVIAFVLNRKKTFRSSRSLLWSGLAYALMVAIILLANAAVNGRIYSELLFRFTEAGLSTQAADALAGTISKMTGGAISGIITFFASKYVIMRK